MLSLELLLERAGYETVTATDGASAHIAKAFGNAEVLEAIRAVLPTGT